MSSAKSSIFKNKMEDKTTIQASSLVGVDSAQPLFWLCNCVSMSNCVCNCVSVCENVCVVWGVGVYMSGLCPFMTCITPTALSVVEGSMVCGEGSDSRAWRPGLESWPLHLRSFVTLGKFLDLTGSQFL